ncbi:MAG TPA: hypothetical protein VE863_17735 [Pyrinomonadaceae bacterium]|jgi:hypothetical protein|nr:hypothetical protein [Pyrinomonadaceae bacterium]
MVESTTKLRDLLTEAIEREQRAYRRSVLLTAVPVIAGLLVFSFFTYRVVKLRQESTTLDQRIGEKSKQLDQLQVSLDVARDEAAQSALRAAKGEQALQEVVRAPDPRKEAEQALRAIASPTPVVKPPGLTPLPTPSPAMGFIGTTFHGQDGTTITVAVSAKGTRLAVSYDLDGKIGYLNDRANTFRFSLDKKRHYPSRLFLFFDYYADKDAAYDVKIAASDGSILNLTVPQGSQTTRTRVLYFDVL